MSFWVTFISYDEKFSTRYPGLAATASETTSEIPPVARELCESTRARCSILPLSMTSVVLWAVFGPTAADHSDMTFSVLRQTSNALMFRKQGR